MRTLFWRSAASLLLLCALAGPGFGIPERNALMAAATLPENWEARMLLRDTIFAPVGEAAARTPAVFRQSDGAANVAFMADTQSGFLYLVFANQKGSSFPVAGAGTFIIKRSMKDGSIVQAKLFVQDDPGCFVRLFPQGDRTVMDVFLFGEPFQSHVVLPVAFDRLLTSPVAHIMDLSASSIDWSIVLASPQEEGDRKLIQVVMAIRERMQGLRDMDDGAMDRNGRMVYIATGDPAPVGKGGFNCSGFAKWVVDGFYAPLTGHDTDIAALKSRDAMRQNRWSARFEEELDPYFGLDWSRGLARALTQARTGRIADDEELDVRDADRVAYIKDVGYPVPRLRYLLYFLARRNPGTMYIGSVNAASALDSQGGTPTLRQHHHVIVLFPYFDAKGAFQVVVMERNLQTSLSSLDRRYGEEYVHLERLGASGEFSLPKLNNSAP